MPTTELPSLAALTACSDAELNGLGAALATAGYDGVLIGRAETIAPRLLDAIRLPAVRAALRSDGSGAAVLGRLFAYGDSVSSEELAKALPERTRALLLHCAIVSEEADRVRSRFRVMPFEQLYVLSDEMDAHGDPVMGPGATTARLAAAMNVEEGASVLDVGCGAGTLALVAARRGAGSVVGVDLHPRAIVTSRINARLNGLAAEFLQGDLTAPVAGRCFELIVSQPAFVIQPPDVESTTYLHGGARGDELTLRLLTELSPLLAEDGRGLVLFDAPIGDALPSVGRRVVEALADAKLIAANLISRGNDPATTAVGYSAVRHPELGAGYAESVRRYHAHLAELGVSGLVSALLSLQPAGDARPIGVTRTVDDLSRFDGPAVRRFEHAAKLVAGDDASLLSASVRVAPDAWLVQEQKAGEEGTRFKVRFEARTAQDHDLSDAAMLLVETVGTGSSVADAVARFAERAGATPDEIRDQVLAFVRESLIAGLLVAL